MDKNYFVNRRTVRRYTNEAISDEIVAQMLA